MKFNLAWRVVQSGEYRYVTRSCRERGAENHAKTIVGCGSKSNCFFQQALEGNASTISTKNEITEITAWPGRII